MPAPRLHENIIAHQIVNLIDQSLSGPLGLKIVTVGALELYPGLEHIEDDVPAVFVKPAPSTALERITTGQTYRIIYNFRIVFVRKFEANEEIVKSKIADTQQIAELLIDNVDLSGLSLSNGQILFSTLKTIEWEPPEDNLVATLNTQMTSTALIFAVETTSRK
jgi:hypothetical protein